MSGDAVQHDRSMSCPRCGHVLHGQMLTWREACPLAGRCPECGLDFQWRDIVLGRLDYPRWCIEGSQGPVGWSWRLLPQVFMATLRPRAMLRRLRMEHRIRPGRLVSAFAAFALVLVLVGWSVVAVTYVREGAPIGAAVRESGRVWDTALRRVLVPLPRPWTGRAIHVGPGRDQILPYEKGSATVVLAPDDAIPESGFAFVRPDGATLVEVGQARGTLVVVRPEYYRTPGGTLVWGVSAAGIVKARQIQTQQIVLAAPVEILGWFMEDVLELLVVAAIPLVLTVAASSLAFVVLPIARRRAKIRWAHLGRLTSYATLGAIGLSCLVLGLVGATGRAAPLEDLVHRLGADHVATWLGVRTEADHVLLAGFVCGLPTLVAATWWSMAARHYLRMAKPVAVGVSVAVVTNLSLVTGLLLVVRVRQ